MNWLTALLFTFGILLCWGCGLHKEAVRKGTVVPSSEAKIVMSSDTIPNPQQPPPPPPGLAPGQAKIRGEIVGTEENETSVLKISVQKTLGYGPATPPLAVSDTLIVQFVDTGQYEISIGKIVSAVISYRHQVEDSGNLPLWTLVSIVDEPNQ